MSRRCWALWLALAGAPACGVQPDNRPVIPGGWLPGGGVGGAGGSGGRDGGADGLPAGLVSGSVCVALTIGDVPSRCLTADLGASSVVEIEGSGAPVVLDPATGAFTLTAPLGAPSVVLRFVPGVTAPLEPAIRQTVVPAQVKLWTIESVEIEQVLASSGIARQPGTALVLAYAVDGTLRNVPSITVAGAPLGQPIWYDQLPISSTALALDGPSGTAGLAVFPNVPSGTLTFDLVPPASAGLQRAHLVLPAQADLLTIAVVKLLP